jgi:ribosome-associated heat shock protein Hsp15
MLDGQLVKPSKVIYPNVKIALKVPPIWKTFEVLDIPPSRVGAKLVSGLLLETTSAEDLEKLSLIAQANRENRALGIKGRPTKKDRRKLDGFQG